mmetsp:Transcript_96684/g.273437  ORF Transcript_96684/g.273437 Transcript_96684/m.273437 type:complete len:294 (-) Transcript_96684:1-882(-)
MPVVIQLRRSVQWLGQRGGHLCPKQAGATQGGALTSRPSSATSQPLRLRITGLVPRSRPTTCTRSWRSSGRRSRLATRPGRRGPRVTSRPASAAAAGVSPGASPRTVGAAPLGRHPGHRERPCPLRTSPWRTCSALLSQLLATSPEWQWQWVACKRSWTTSDGMCPRPLWLAPRAWAWAWARSRRGRLEALPQQPRRQPPPHHWKPWPRSCPPPLKTRGLHHGSPRAPRRLSCSVTCRGRSLPRVPCRQHCRTRPRNPSSGLCLQSFLRRRGGRSRRRPPLARAHHWRGGRRR